MTSWVRNALIHDADDELKIVLWGETALIPVSPGNQVEIYHATAKPGRFGGIELGVGRGSAFRVPEETVRPILFSGTIIAGPGCLFIDNGSERYLIEGTFTHGSEVTVTGLLSGSRIIPEQVEQVVLDAESVLRNVLHFQDELKS
jgi:replication factor A1